LVFCVIDRKREDIAVKAAVTEKDKKRIDGRDEPVTTLGQQPGK
jgi:hypothetical protein